MKTPSCPHEDAVVAAARSGDWSPELLAHRDGCLGCAQLTLVVAALATDAEKLNAIDVPLPDPASILLRAHLASREWVYRRATRAIVWFRRAAVAIALAVGIAFAPGLWRFASGLFSAVDLSLSAPDLPRAAGSPLLVLVGSILVLGGLALWELTVQQEN